MPENASSIGAPHEQSPNLDNLSIKDGKKSVKLVKISKL
jgi:hypothetical protein